MRYTISYSGWFDFTDAAILSKFASVTNEPELVAAIINLKYIYYQVGRHVEEAASLAVSADRSAITPTERNKILQDASHAQQRALAFFRNENLYADTIRETSLIIEASKKTSPGKVVDNLSARFEHSIKAKKGLDGKLFPPRYLDTEPR